MAIDGTTIKTRSYFDKDTNQYVNVNLSVRDIIYFELLEKIERAIDRIK